MERREHYDPEDIEDLLQQRGFDELLDEERAYVLRHLSGREEYESMRALLRQVRENDNSRSPIDAGEHVRQNVLQAFREQQRPQWRIWLNSIGGVFAPGEGFAMIWRPALALGVLVLLFAIGIQLVKGPLFRSDGIELAEVRKTEAPKTPIKEDQHEKEQNAPVPVEETTSEVEFKSGATPMQEERLAKSITSKDEILNPEDGLAEVVIDEMEDEEFAGAALAEEQFASGASADAMVPAAKHEVTESELMMNSSTANASGKVTARMERDKKIAGVNSDRSLAAESRSIAQDPEVMALMSAGW